MREKFVESSSAHQPPALSFVPGVGIESFEDWVESKFQEVKRRTIEKYPHLAADIERSLKVPQSPKYHAEGKTMIAHLKLNIRTLHNIARGIFPAELDADTRDMLYRTVVSEGSDGTPIVNPELEEYVFLHDISKADCLCLKFEGTDEVAEISWDEWLAIERQGEPYHYTNPTTGAIEPIEGIGYFHPSKGAEGQHGEHGVNNKLDALEISDRIKLAIANHEIAFSFDTSSAQKFIELFVQRGFTDPEDQAFILTASCVDSASSLGPGGTPHLENFKKLIQARRNYELLNEYINQGARIRDNHLQELKNKNGALTRKEIEARIIRNRTYDIPAVREALRALVASGEIEQSDMDAALDTLEHNKDQQQLGRLLKEKMVLVKPILQKHEV